ncbi:hypothetical protein EHW66_13660 [Erwinia psidii]|uniref:MucR family transcriptional regulator n=1 Tax=Erwinia psidii TaxID=69224 RepID=UPI00226B1BE6|nr:MucR family transcriptional regulator [Erwinia psidii]MCX8965999.1 hypothetical protein [Erwinia psidii]
MNERWRNRLPPELHVDAEALLVFLRSVPDMKPEHCPLCGGAKLIQRDPRLYECRECRRRFTPWTGTPFANSRHPESWATYAEARLCGMTAGKAYGIAGLSHGAGEHRESVISQIISKRWPRLVRCWNGPGGADLQVTSLRDTPFTSKEEAWAHHNHEYVQCLECGKMFASLEPHLRGRHGMRALEYREKWQIMQQIPISGLAKRRLHSASIKEKIASGQVEPLVLAAAMNEACRKNGRKKPFVTAYMAELHRDRLQKQQPWLQSPAIKTVDEDIQRQAALRMHLRHQNDERVETIAEEFGVVKQTLYVWMKRWPDTR